MWYPGGGTTGKDGAEHDKLASFFSTVASERFKIFLMENEFPLIENGEMLGAEDAIPMFAIMTFAQGGMLHFWACNMAAFSRLRSFGI